MRTSTAVAMLAVAAMSSTPQTDASSLARQMARSLNGPPPNPRSDMYVRALRSSATGDNWLPPDRLSELGRKNARRRQTHRGKRR